MRPLWWVRHRLLAAAAATQVLRHSTRPPLSFLNFLLHTNACFYYFNTLLIHQFELQHHNSDRFLMSPCQNPRPKKRPIGPSDSWLTSIVRLQTLSCPPKLPIQLQTPSPPPRRLPMTLESGQQPEIGLLVRDEDLPVFPKRRKLITPERKATLNIWASSIKESQRRE